jgi:hypothetical protein
MGSIMSRTRTRAAPPEPESKPTDAAAFWSEFAVALDRVEEFDDDDVMADALVRFLEPRKSIWLAITASMRASALRRSLIERACLILARRDVDDGLAS